MSTPTSSPHSSRNPTIKRIQREALELVRSPSPDFTAFPLETNLFEWHFTLRGPPPPSPYATGIYHGRIVLPATYPLRPPSFRFLTPSGRFEVNREICLSISGHHEESWQPAWGIRTALVAIRSFMDTDAKGQVGGVDANREVREGFARQSRSWKCAACGEGKSNEEIMRAVEKGLLSEGGDVEEKRREDKVPDELRLGYRDELGKADEAPEAGTVAPPTQTADAAVTDTATNHDEHLASAPAPAERTTRDEQRIQTAGQAAQPQTQLQRLLAGDTSVITELEQRERRQQQQQAHQQQQRRSEDTNWLDMAIAGIATALFFMIVRKVVQYL